MTLTLKALGLTLSALMFYYRDPGLSQAQPWAELSNAFSVTYFAFRLANLCLNCGRPIVQMTLTLKGLKGITHSAVFFIVPRVGLRQS